MERFSISLDGRVPTGSVNAYLVGAPERLLLDPASRTDDLDRAVAAQPVEHVAVTHAHPDHVDAVAHYARETDATVWARYGRTDAFERATGIQPDRTFRDGTEIPGTGVSVIDTPGHAPDHVAFVRGSAAAIGDLALARGSLFVVDVRAYLISLRRLRGRGFERLYPGHGDPIDAPAARLESIIEHRLDREQKILDAVHDGARTLEAVVDAAYGSDLGDARFLAERVARAHLEKLAVEDKVQFDGDHVAPA